MTDEIKVGQLTKSFWKNSQRPSKITKTPAESYAESVDSVANLQELARRLSNLENQITLKVDSGKIISAIVLAEEALMITSDMIAVVGQTSFYDYVRDHNGTATGVLDPSMTMIRGGVIQTEMIISSNWPEEGSAFDLDNGNLTMGGFDDPKLQYINDNSGTATLEVRGNIAVRDTADPLEYGMFLTGDVGYTSSGGFTGTTGVLMGTPGIFAVSGGKEMFALEVATGDARFGGSIDTEGYVKSSGNEDTGLRLFLVDAWFDVEASMYGANDVDVNNTTGAFVSGVVGSTKGAPSSTGRSIGVLGVTDGDGSSSNGDYKYGVAGIGYDFGQGAFFYSSLGIGVTGSTDGVGQVAMAGDAEEGYAGAYVGNSSVYPVLSANNLHGTGQPAVFGQNTSTNYGAILGLNNHTSAGFGVSAQGANGLHALANQADGYGVYSEGHIGVADGNRFMKNTQSEGRLYLYSTTSGAVQETWYYRFDT